MKRFLYLLMAALSMGYALHGQVQFDYGTLYDIGTGANGMAGGLVMHADNNSSRDLVYGINTQNIHFRPMFVIYSKANNGSGSFGSSTALLTFDGFQTTNYALSDLSDGNFDGSSYKDLAFVYSENSINKLAVYKYSASGFTSPFTINLPSGTLKMMAVGNINGVASTTDELDDIAIAINDVVYIYKNSTTSGSLSFGQYNPGTQQYDPNYTIDNTKLDGHHNLNGIRGIGFVDYQRYGSQPFYDDLVIVDNDTPGDELYESRHIDNRIYGNPTYNDHWKESTFGSTNNMTTLLYENRTNVSTCYIDNDNYAELMMDGGVKDAVTKAVTWNVPPYDAHLIGHDIDCDGKTDIMGSSHYSFLGNSGTEAKIYMNDGANNYPDATDEFYFTEVTNEGPAWVYDPIFADIQGNGSPALVIFSQASSVHVNVFKRLDNAPPSKPVMKSIVEYQTHPKVKWFTNPEADVTQYQVYRGLGTETTPPSSYALIGTTSASEFVDQEITWTNTNTTKKMYYKVRAKDAINQYSAHSNPMKINYLADIQKAGGNNALSFKLTQNFPNPFNPSTRISYEIPEADYVTLKIYNVLGQRVATLVNAYQEAGAREITWNGKDDSGDEVASGLYLYQLQAGDHTKTMKMNLLK